MAERRLRKMRRAGHGDGRHSGRENDVGLLLGDGGNGFIDALDGQGSSVESGLIEDLGEHCGDEVVGAVELVEASDGAADFTNMHGMVEGSADGVGVSLAGRRDGASGVGNAEFFTDFLNFTLRAAVG